MRRAWRRIAQADPVTVDVDLGKIGICAIGEREGDPVRVRIPLV